MFEKYTEKHAGKSFFLPVMKPASSAALTLRRSICFLAFC